MSGAGFQRALAELLTVPATRRTLRDRPAVLAARFRLTADELTVLTAAGRARLDLTANSATAKRLDLVSRGLPATSHALAASGHLDEVRAGFVEHNRPVRSTTDTVRQVADGQRFADHLRQVATPDIWYTPDLAAYEVMLARVALESRPARDAGSRLGRHVALGCFDADVIHLHETWSRSGAVPVHPPHRPTWLVVAKVPGQATIARFRLGRQAYEFLAGADPVATSDAERAVERFAREQGLLRPPTDLEH